MRFWLRAEKSRIPRLQIATRRRGLYVLLLASFPMLAAAANTCTPAPRAPGTPINAPHAAFEAYVVAVHAVKDAHSPFGAQLARQALVEVVRSFHGPYNAGQQVETITLVGAHSCGGFVEEGGHVMVISESGGPFEIVEALPKSRIVPQGPFAALAYAAGETRRSLHPSSKNALLRGEIDAALAAELHARARPEQRQRSEIVSDGNYAQVSWGKAFGGNDARSKVIFERAQGGWIEILRYQAPEPTPVRNRSKRGRQRTLWAGSSVDPCHCYSEMRHVPISSRGASSAMTTS
ncbi:MAG TPA: hypothetical protein VFS58_06805 [Steroidobacteraceae bacterium]|nr:hypothetical protein [Steroidobacteraceae bacterium]